MWNIAMFHRSPYSSNPLTGTDATADTFAPVLEELGVDLVLTGHDHAYMKSHLMEDGQVQTDGSGSQYIIGGSAGPKFYPAQNYDYTDVLYDEDKQVFTSIEIDGNKLHGEVYSIDNEQIDTFELQKQGEEDDAAAPDRSYNFKDTETDRLLVHKPSVSLTFDADFEVKNGIVFTGNYAEFHGAGLKGATITIKPEKDGAVIDFKETEAAKVIIDGDNSELKGADNIQEIEYINGADPETITTP
ncbi:metallophosphoesterase [Salibacterium sp. K-3]